VFAESGPDRDVLISRSGRDGGASGVSERITTRGGAVHSGPSAAIAEEADGYRDERNEGGPRHSSCAESWC
jgi:hypothetical protein